MLDKELTVAVEAAHKAGAVIRKWYDGDFTVAEKSTDSPVTEADTEANREIHAAISAAFPDDGWLSEETKDSPARLGKRRAWIIDPLDGTKEFIKHIPEFCVCIGLVEEGTPILGVCYNPITDEMFTGTEARGVRVGDTVTTVTDLADLAAARVLASRSEVGRGEWQEFEQDFTVELTGSVAFKFALVAAGRADATFSLVPKNEWDVCAGTALVTFAGGRVTNRFGEPIRFNSADPLLPGIIASNGRLYDPIVTLLTGRGKMAR